MSRNNRTQWLIDIKNFRDKWRKKVGYKYDNTVFDRPDLKWTQTSYIQVQMHPYDRYFYDLSLLRNLVRANLIFCEGPWVVVVI